jgi:hypothetical protein
MGSGRALLRATFVSLDLLKLEVPGLRVCPRRSSELRVWPPVERWREAA